MSKVKDSFIISALIKNNGNIRLSAKDAGVAESTIYAKMKSRDFRSEYRYCVHDKLTEDLTVLAGARMQAIKTLTEICGNADEDAKDRIRASVELLQAYDVLAKATDSELSKAKTLSQTDAEILQDFGD